MNKEIIVHIGLHRTGTTFLQKDVFEKIKDINYIFDDALHRIHIEEGINLISNEGLSLSMPHSFVYRIQVLDFLKTLFPDAKIILGFRDTDKWLKSCYYRYVISGGQLSFDWYLKHYKDNIIDFDKYEFEVKKRFKHVYIYTQEDLVKNREGVINGMCNFIGCEVPKYKVVRRNVSLSGSQLNVVRYFNKFHLGKYVMEVIKRLRRTPT